MQKRLIPAMLAAALFISVLLSFLSIHQLQGNARVVNYAGVVRGATQRLVKQELYGRPDDELIASLDALLAELATGEGENGLGRMDDAAFQSLIGEMRAGWDDLKAQIEAVRAGAAPAALFEMSEAYFDLANRTVFAAEACAERQVRRAEGMLLVLGAVFLLLSAAVSAGQARRQRALQRAEAENRAKSENLQQMTLDLRAPLDAISELMYVSDLETHELLFINEAGRESFGVRELCGQKCYEVLQGRDIPCDFCSTPHLVPGENYTWEFTNPITKKHYLLKDRLLQWEGRPARLEIAFDISEAEAEKQALKSTLDAEQTLIECVQALYRERDYARSFPMVLERMGRFLSAEQALLLIFRDGRFQCDFEWTREGTESQRERICGLPLSTAEGWKGPMTEQGAVVIEDVETIRETHPEAYALLSSYQVRTLVCSPLECEGERIGSLIVRNAVPGQLHSIAPLLQTLCFFLSLTYERTKNEQQLSQLSYYDTLTSFYNRNRYIEDSAVLSQYAGPMGVVYLDVNGLKDINDQQGHAMGDRVLVQCAQRIRRTFRQADFYRIGGDEFVILCPGVDRENFTAWTAELRRRFDEDELCHAAIGARWTEHFEDFRQLVADADADMYEDKKNFYRRFPASNRYRHLSDDVLHLSDPEVLRDEIRRERFVIYLQPKLSSSDRSAVGAEALVRYHTRSGSLMLPGNFLPMLEESQTISQIDFYVFEYACTRLREWQRLGKPTPPISVNFSRSSLSQPDFVERLTALCDKYDVQRRCLEIELTETAHEGKDVNLKELTHNLRQAGFVVSIDDFGSEYANLSLLSTVEFDVLKLDKSLVDDVARNPKARTVVQNVVGICRDMQISVIAEGIETEEQLLALRECGVELVQGFLFSKPIPISEYEEKYL